MSVPAFSLVMPGLDPGIHAFPARCFEDVDGRNTCGHDDGVIQEGAR
ncbi:hypothetical protein [Microvirga sp. TS319]